MAEQIDDILAGATHLLARDNANGTTGPNSVGSLTPASVRTLLDVPQTSAVATAAQGALADSALQPTDVASGTITPFDGDLDFSGGLGGGAGDVTAAAVIPDNVLVRGDGGAKGVQGSGITIADDDDVTFPENISAKTLIVSATPDPDGNQTDYVKISTANGGGRIEVRGASFSKYFMAGRAFIESANRNFVTIGDGACLSLTSGSATSIGDTRVVRRGAGVVVIQGSNFSPGALALDAFTSDPGAIGAGGIVRADRVTWDPLGLGSGGSYLVMRNDADSGWVRIDSQGA